MVIVKIILVVGFWFGRQFLDLKDIYYGIIRYHVDLYDAVILY